MRINGWTGRALGLLVTTSLLAVAVACQGTEPTRVADNLTPAQPYAGLQERDIRALSQERVADLLAGRGAGYALAAELNHYPGPTHVLEIGVQLQLTPEQIQAVSAIKAAMQQDAAQLGKQMVDLEEDLDRAFRLGVITSQDISRLTKQIAEVEGKLRNVHLQAHLQTKEVLTREQVTSYDKLRGYTTGDDEHGAGHGTPGHQPE